MRFNLVMCCTIQVVLYLICFAFLILNQLLVKENGTFRSLVPVADHIFLLSGCSDREMNILPFLTISLKLEGPDKCQGTELGDNHIS